MLTLKSSKGSITINKDAAQKLELKLNVSNHARNWVTLGDMLYEAHTTPHHDECRNLHEIITEEQFYWVLQYI